jgi:predicted  nucleic acid-binding Zn-ribbon protein
VKVNLQDQQSLLVIAELDLEKLRVENEKTKLANSPLVADARAKLLEVSDRLIDSRNAVADLELELKRSENDLELVESRIEKDKVRLNQTSSPKDAQGIEHELETLARRRSELEDAELAVMEQLEQVRGLHEKLENDRTNAQRELAEAEQQSQKLASELAQSLERISSQRLSKAATVAPDALIGYERKAARGTAIAKLSGRECGSCRLSITASFLDEINARPADELAECPNCLAYLVRT